MIANRRVVPEAFVKSIVNVAAVSDHYTKDTSHTVEDDPIWAFIVVAIIKKPIKSDRKLHQAVWVT